MKPDMLQKDASSGSLPVGAKGYAPTSWWTAAKAEAQVQELMRRGGLFGTRLPRDVAERQTLALMRKNGVGIMSGTVGSWLLNDEEQLRLLNKVDDVRFDIRLAGRRASIGLGLLAASLGVLGVASIVRNTRRGE